jgi:hypothetical protein
MESLTLGETDDVGRHGTGQTRRPVMILTSEQLFMEASRDT